MEIIDKIKNSVLNSDSNYIHIYLGNKEYDEWLEQRPKSIVSNIDPLPGCNPMPIEAEEKTATIHHVHEDSYYSVSTE